LRAETYGAVTRLWRQNANYDREYAVDLKQLTAFLEATQEEIAGELQLRTDGPVEVAPTRSAPPL
jgi:hypothetical protein